MAVAAHVGAEVNTARAHRNTALAALQAHRTIKNMTVVQDDTTPRLDLVIPAPMKVTGLGWHMALRLRAEVPTVEARIVADDIDVSSYQEACT